MNALMAAAVLVAWTGATLTDVTAEGTCKTRPDDNGRRIGPKQAAQGSGGAGCTRQSALYKRTGSEQYAAIQAIRPDRQALPALISGRNALWHFRSWISD